MKSVTILITMPRKKGDPTEYTFEWATEAVKIAQNLGYNVIAIKEKDTTYNNVTEAIKKYKPRLMTHWGHGCPNSLQGNTECIVTRRFSVDDIICMLQYPEERQKVLKLLNPLGELSCPGICSLSNDPCGGACTYDTNVNLLKDSIIYSVACHSSSQLGVCSIKYGIQTYIGEDDLLMFPVDSKNSQDIFGDVQLTFFKELLMGRTVQEAEKAMSELEDSYIRQFKRVKYVALPLLWNKIHRKVLGNSNNLIYSNI